MNTPENSQSPTRWWDWPAAFLLAATILVAAFRLNATSWTKELDLIQTVAFLGVIAGLALGKSAFSPGIARLFAFVYGSFVVFWQVGLTLGEGVLWPERMISIGNRLLIILDQIFQQKPVTDNLFFNLLMAILFWILSTYAGYSLTRQGSAWRAILPLGLVLIIIQAYDSHLPIRTWFLAGYIFLALLLVARLHFVNLRFHWRNIGTYLPPYVSLDSLRLGLITTIILVLFAWTAPAVASALPQAEQIWLDATRPWTDMRNRLSNVFYSLQASVGIVTDFYGDYLPLGRGNPLSDTIIMKITAPPRAPGSVRYYWRSRVYDSYDVGWSSSLPVVQPITPDNFDLNFPEYDGRFNSTFTITTSFPIQNLQTPSQPVWVSRPGEAYIGVNSDGTVDLSHVKADPVLRSGDTYQVESSLVSASIMELREAGTDYPAWITDRYLQLPDSISPRTRQLAEEIAAGLENPYDITQEITNFLRTNLDYNDTVPSPPEDQEPIDWILFDHKRAFCNYYATAEIVMLRSLGIPARLAVGYAEGERLGTGGIEEVPTLQPGGENIPQDIEISGDIFNVRHRDAHAWPEVYFPDIGWVEFEPTVSQQPILRPLGNLSSTSQEPLPSSQIDELQDRARRRLDELSEVGSSSQNSPSTTIFRIPLAVWIAFFTLLVVSIVFLARRIRIARGSPPLPVQLESGLKRTGIKSPQILRQWVRYSLISPLTRAYLELNRALSRLGRSPRITDTPAERASALIQVLPTAEEYVQEVLVPYQYSIYGNLPQDPDNAMRAGKEIRKLSYIVKFKRFLARFQEPKRDKRSLDQ